MRAGVTEEEEEKQQMRMIMMRRMVRPTDAIQRLVWCSQSLVGQ